MAPPARPSKCLLGIFDKIESKHGEAFQEVEQACYSEDRHVRRGRADLYKVFSRTEAGRYLLVVLVGLKCYVPIGAGPNWTIQNGP